MATDGYFVKVASLKIDATKLDAALDSKEVEDKTDECAEASLAMMQRLVPVDSGDLRKSLEIIREGRKRLVGSKLDYAGPVELGHQQGRTWVPAQPYIRPSIDAVRAVMKRGT